MAHFYENIFLHHYMDVTLDSFFPMESFLLQTQMQRKIYVAFALHYEIK